MPDRLQGRVNATARAIAVSGTPAGAFLAGVLVGPLSGVRTVFLVLAGVAMLNAIGLFHSVARCYARLEAPRSAWMLSCVTCMYAHVLSYAGVVDPSGRFRGRR